MQFAPAKLRFQLRNLCLASCAACLTRFLVSNITRPIVSLFFLVIVEVEAKINSCIFHLKDGNLKNFITCTKIEKYASKC